MSSGGFPSWGASFSTSAKVRSAYYEETTDSRDWFGHLLTLGLPVSASECEAFSVILPEAEASSLQDELQSKGGFLGIGNEDLRDSTLRATILFNVKTSMLSLHGVIKMSNRELPIRASGMADNRILSDGERFLYGVISGELVVNDQIVPLSAVVHSMPSSQNVLIPITLGFAGDVGFPTVNLMYGKTFQEIEEYFDLCTDTMELAGKKVPSGSSAQSEPMPLVSFTPGHLEVNSHTLVTAAAYSITPMEYYKTYGAAARIWSHTTEASQWLDLYGNPIPDTMTYDGRVDRVRATINAPTNVAVSGETPESGETSNTIGFIYLWKGTPNYVSFSYVVDSTSTSRSSSGGSYWPNAQNWTEYRLSGWDNSATDLPIPSNAANDDVSHGFKYTVMQTPQALSDCSGTVSGDLRYILYRKRLVSSGGTGDPSDDEYEYWSEVIQTQKASASYTVTIR